MPERQESVSEQQDTVRDAILAMCVMVSYADRHPEETEAEWVPLLSSVIDTLKDYTEDSLKRRYKDMLFRAMSDADGGKSRLLGHIGKVKTRRDDSRNVINAGIWIGSNGMAGIPGQEYKFSDVEKAAVREACSVLGQDPADYGL